MRSAAENLTDCNMATNCLPACNTDATTETRLQLIIDLVCYFGKLSTPSPTSTSSPTAIAVINALLSITASGVIIEWGAETAATAAR